MTDNPWQNKRVLITGLCGTVGRELLRQVVMQEPEEIIGLDNNESELFFLDEEYRQHANVRMYLGDMRDRDKLVDKMRGIDVVLHSAALKHVILCEESPRDAVQTNILGTQNVIDAAIANRVERVLFTSSDKAVNPTNVMATGCKMHGSRPAQIAITTLDQYTHKINSLRVIGFEQGNPADRLSLRGVLQLNCKGS